MPGSPQHDIVVPLIAASFLLLIFGYFFIIIILFYRRRRHQHTKEMTELKHNYEQTLLKSQLEIQEETLRHISQEIHDNIGQVLSLAKLQLNTLPVPPLQENLEAFTTTKTLISKAITDLRSLSKSLHPDRVNELGLEENIRHELDMLQKTHLYETQLQINGSIYKIPIQTQTILFRMVQEAISNIIKHANATTVHVIMDYEPTQFCLTIMDNGIGIDKIILSAPVNGIGIRNMKNRSGIIGASFEIGATNEDGGTSIRICWPVMLNV